MALRKTAVFLQIGILIISAIINFNAYSKGYMPTLFQAFFQGCVFLLGFLTVYIMGINAIYLRSVNIKQKRGY